MTTIPTASRPIELTELPPRLTAKLAILRATDPGLYAAVTKRDPITNQPLNEPDRDRAKEPEHWPSTNTAATTTT